MMVLRQPAVASGLLTHDEVDAFLRMTLDPDAQYVPFVMASVLGPPPGLSRDPARRAARIWDPARREANFGR